MASTPPQNPRDNPNGAKTLIYSYPNRIWKALLSYLPSPDSSLLAKLSNLSPLRSRGRSRRQKPGLPLPLHSNAVQSSLTAAKATREFVILEDIMEHTLHCLHNIQKSLVFWQSRAEGTNTQKIYFMMFERGPRAFIDGTYQLITRLGTVGSPIQHLCCSASDMISEKIAILTSLQHCLATFLAQVYLEVNRYGEMLTEDSDKSLPSLLVAINTLFSKLEASVSHPREIYKSDNSFSTERGNSCALLFEKIPQIDPERSQWTDTEARDATNLIYQNLQRLDSYLSFILSSCQKPRRVTLYWLHYTCGTVGLSVCSLWLLRHSSLMGSPDMDNWIREAKESTAGFWKDHVEQPLISIRDELFETFRGRHKGVMEVEEVKLTEDSLHRMLLTFCEQTKGEKLPENMSDQEMLEIVMARYEKELMHPLHNLLSGELARAMLIQIQKLKLDLETAMLELDQILKANEINFAVLAALPAFFLSLLLIMLVRAWVRQDKSAEGRGRIARRQRRLLVVEVEKRLMQFQTCMDQGMEDDARCIFGLLLYSLDRLYKAVEGHAKETGEWLSLRQDIVDIGKPGLKTAYKLAVVSRMERMYECLLPSSKRK
ncbi:protein DGS1, mitochondrial [Elaeis guineensis]|uniref:Protein DGS1, mitochondrial n=1 Tax=Elaeis guineensis var. tenera TaxID=51953 RepID=A0A6I9QCB0_ELAGV|nr:protein DGS1, mitochondrial [Elaeis guineensis]